MKTQSNRTMNLIRAGLLVLLLVIFGFQSFTTRIMSNAPFDSVASAVTSTLNPDVYPQREPVSVTRYFGLDPAQFEQIALYRSEDAMSADELLLAKFETKEAQKAFEDAVKERIASQKSIYEGYAPEQATQMEAALVDVQGNYGLYYVGDDPAKIDELFRNALRKGGE